MFSETPCMFKGNSNRTVFIKARLAQSAEHRALNLKVVGSSPTVGKKFILCILSLLMRS